MSDILLVRLSLRTDPKVVRLGEVLVADPDLVVGKLIHLWSYVQENGDDGLIEYAGRERVDAIVGMMGFSDALVKINWLHFDLQGAHVLGYEQYLGTEGMRTLIDHWLKLHPKPQGCRSHPADPGFTDFWTEYPRKTAQKAAEKVWRRLKPDETLRRRMMDALRLDKRSNQWSKGNGEFIPHPSTWLNQERWNDERRPTTTPECGRVAAREGKYAHLSGATSATDAQPGDPDAQGPGSGAGGLLFTQDDPPAGGG